MDRDMQTWIKQVLWGRVFWHTRKACSFLNRGRLVCSMISHLFCPPPPQQDPVVSTKHTWQVRDRRSRSMSRGIPSSSLLLRCILLGKRRGVSGPLGVCGHMWVWCSSWEFVGTRKLFVSLRSSEGGEGDNWRGYLFHFWMLIQRGRWFGVQTHCAIRIAVELACVW